MNRNLRPQVEDRYPDTLVAECNREQAEQLINFDHHGLCVRGRWGVMLTYHWMERPIREALEPLLLKVVFHYADAHPPAPARVQGIVDQLTFVPAAENVNTLQELVAHR